MASYNLVQVGATTNLAVGGFATETYGCDNFESILLDISKDGQAGGDTSAQENLIFITIQAGTETIVNRVPMSLFTSLNKYLAGTGIVTAWGNASSSAGQALLEIETGTHYIDKGQELTVQIQNGTLNSLTYKIYAKVNGISTPSPQKWLYRTDQAFSLPLVESLYCFATNTANLLESSGNTTLQYGTENVLVPISAGACMVNADSVGDSIITNMSLVYDGIPREMQINTTTSNIGYLAQVKEVAPVQMIKRARSWIPNKFKGLSRKERIVLAQGH